MEATNRTLPVASVADARVKEGPDATLDFVVTLNAAASGAVTVDYATADGTAKAGRGLRGGERDADVRGGGVVGDDLGEGAGRRTRRG